VPLCTNGALLHGAAIIGDGSLTNIAAGNCYIGLGDSNTGHNVAQTDLQASTNKLRKLATSVTRNNLVLTFVTTFSTSEANFAIEETGIFNASVSGLMVARKVQSLGTKTSAYSLQVTYTTTLAA
jgi:hypothetical protein